MKLVREHIHSLYTKQNPIFQPRDHFNAITAYNIVCMITLALKVRNVNGMDGFCTFDYLELVRESPFMRIIPETKTFYVQS